MKIRLKDSYDGPIPKDVLHEALRGKNAGYDCYVITFENSIWYIHINSAEEVDEFEEAFKMLCMGPYLDSKIYFPSGHLETVSDWVFSHNGRLVRKEDIPSLILALLKLMED